MATWELFFASSEKPIAFAFDDIDVTTGKDVARATAIGTASLSPRAANASRSSSV